MMTAAFGLGSMSVQSSGQFHTYEHAVFSAPKEVLPFRRDHFSLFSFPHAKERTEKNAESSSFPHLVEMNVPPPLFALLLLSETFMTSSAKKEPIPLSHERSIIAGEEAIRGGFLKCTHDVVCCTLLAWTGMKAYSYTVNSPYSVQYSI